MGRGRHRRRVQLSLSAVLAGLALVIGMTGNSASVSQTVSQGGFSFLNYQLGDLPSEYCPDVNSACQNHASEPQIRADKFGNFFVSSENGITSGTEAWKSVDGGLHYVHLPSPNQLSNPKPGAPPTNVSPAGGDTDLATASEKNSLNIYNVYVASLEVTSVFVSTSQDGGHTWNKLDPKASTVPGDDREWIAADGASKVCISYHDAASLGIHVDCSYDAGQTFVQTAQAVDANHLATRLMFVIGNLMIDQNSNTGDAARNNDIVYQSFASGTQADSTNPNPTGHHVVYMAVSTDGGKNFTDYTVYQNPNVTADYGHQFINESVDQAGNVYAFFTDDHNLYYKFSTDHGQTWQPGGPNGAPIQINKPASNTAIFPWSAAGSAGKVDVVWYGTSTQPTQTAGAGDHPDSYPSTATWYVYFAQNLNAISAPTAWTQVQASPIIHFGAVCEGGISCSGNRDLYDDFGVAIRPTTGLASITYSDDQFDQYNQNVGSAENTCTAGLNNSGSCDHTSIATQTSGAGVVGNGGGGAGGCHEGDAQGSIHGKSGGTATFQSDEDSCADRDQDSEQMKDSGAGADFHSTSIQSVVFDDSLGTMTIYGQGLDNGKAVTFVIEEQAPNGLIPAIYSIQLSDGYTNSGSLISGSIALH